MNEEVCVGYVMQFLALSRSSWFWFLIVDLAHRCRWRSCGVQFEKSIAAVLSRQAHKCESEGEATCAKRGEEGGIGNRWGI